jgi:flagellar protein FlaI
VFKQISELRHIPKEELEEELKKRSMILQWMVKENLKSYDDVSEIIHTYYTNPEEILTKARFEVKN